MTCICLNINKVVVYYYSVELFRQDFFFSDLRRDFEVVLYQEYPRSALFRAKCYFFTRLPEVLISGPEYFDLANRLRLAE